LTLVVVEDDDSVRLYCLFGCFVTVLRNILSFMALLEWNNFEP